MSIFEDSLKAASESKAEVRAGGTDLMDRIRQGLTTGEIIDIHPFIELSEIKEAGNGGYTIGCMVTVAQLAAHPKIKKNYPGIALAAGNLANPQIRRAATVGGALLQRSRCWYYRHEGYSCFKKGGDSCPMRNGNHQYGVCFDLGPCVAPHPSTLGMAMLVYDAEIKKFGVGQEPIDTLYGNGQLANNDHTLATGEILEYIYLPPPLENEKAAYHRAISRAAAEWPLVEALVRGEIEDGKMKNITIGLGGVANIPLVLPQIAKFLTSKRPSQALFLEAGKMAILEANPLEGTAYKLPLVVGTIQTVLEKAFEDAIE